MVIIKSVHYYNSNGDALYVEDRHNVLDSRIQFPLLIRIRELRDWGWGPAIMTGSRGSGCPWHLLQPPILILLSSIVLHSVPFFHVLHFLTIILVRIRLKFTTMIWLTSYLYLAT